MAENEQHVPVLFDEVLAGLAIRPDGIYLDGTFGRGGHARAILAQLSEHGRLLATDRDPEAVATARHELGEDPRFSILRGSYTVLAHEVAKRGWNGRVDGILLDLGVSSPQLDDPRRGFSFRADGPLDMRMDPDTGESAADWLAHAGDAEIARVLKEYGEERYAKRIARAIVRERDQNGRIETTGRLAEVIAAAHPRWERDRHPATRSFQAIRIHVNRELDELDTVLSQVLDMLAPGGRLAVISFHSLEDRRVKRFIRECERGRDDLPPDLPVRADVFQPKLRHLGKAIHAGEAELARNPRARSAVLRLAEKPA